MTRLQSVPVPLCWLLIALALVLGACAPREPAPPDPDTVRERVAEAEQMLADDRPLGAARIYDALAEETEGHEATRWRLEVVELLFDHDYPEAGLEQHRALDAREIPRGLALRKRVTDAQAAVARQQAILALRTLPAITPEQDERVQARIHETRARALQLEDRPARALASWIEARALHGDLEDERALARNRQATWNLLDSLERETLETIATEAETADERGWATLTLAERRARTGQVSVDEAFAAWRASHPHHPAAERFADTLRERVIERLTYPERVDVLLPLSGSLTDRAGAIRDGLIAAYYEIPDYINQPELVFHDIGDEGFGMMAAYERAVESGAGFVIGPLERHEVARFTDIYELPVPVLSLNYLRADAREPPPELYQFGLRPEDEARQAAEAAVRNNRFNAVVLVPSGEWGERMERAFTERFEELGGAVVATRAYNPDQTDHRQRLQSVLNIDDSIARLQRLRNTLGTSDIEFDPRRRDDIEVVFLAAQPRQGRLLKPQLDFHRIGRTPVYATSHVFTGAVDPDADRDMNDLYFTESPWLLARLNTNPDGTARARADWPDSHIHQPRLFALGADALEILPILDQLREGMGDAHPGRTGRLTMSPDGRIARELDWAQFVRGRPMPADLPDLEPPAPLPHGQHRERADDED